MSLNAIILSDNNSYRAMFQTDTIEKNQDEEKSMHEMSYCIRLVNMACENVDIEHEKVTELSVNVGAMTGIVPEYLQKYFPEAAKGTIAENAKLVIHPLPVSGVCSDCQKSYEPSAENDYRCPFCKSLKFDLKTGREFDLISISAKKA